MITQIIKRISLMIANLTNKKFSLLINPKGLSYGGLVKGLSYKFPLVFGIFSLGGNYENRD